MHRLTRDELRQLSELSPTVWTFRFYMEYEECGHLKELWSCALTDIGGTHPLLVGFNIFGSFFYDFTRKILVRCGGQQGEG